MDNTEFFGENPLDTEQLHPELKPYLSTIPTLGVCLRHPLVYQVPFCSWKTANVQLVEKRRRLRMAMDAGQWEQALWWYERPFRMSQLYEWFVDAEIGIETVREILPGAWMDTENEEQHRTSSLELFRAAGFVTDAPNKPEGRLTIYHGVENGESELGIAWTLSLDVARWFAQRFGRHDHILRGEIDADKILAYLVGRHEEEIVVDPLEVENIEILPAEEES